MRVSAVIPLYNKASYVQRAVKSVINQDTPIEEIIVVDDGSTDGGGELINKEILDHRVRVIHQTNGGESAARNRGIAEAKNDLIAFLDADDEWKPDFLSRIQKLIDLFPEAGAYATSAEIIKSDQSRVYPRLGNLPKEPWVDLLPDFFALFQDGYAFNASSIVVPKEVLEEVGGFPAGVPISGDVTCWVKIAIRHPIAFDSARSVIYHQEAQNRIGNRYKITHEMPYIKIIQDAIREGIMPIHMRESSLDFAAQKQIKVAAQNVMTGDPAYARELLTTCKDNKKYRREWLKWRFLAALPVGWPQQIMKLKNFRFTFS